jgi:signal transduction histidine kinase
LQDDTIRLIYSDDGQGIPPELQSKVFDPFFTTQRGSGGSGLGLHIVYNAVRQTLKGKLQMHSAQAQGTMFTLHFPRICPFTMPTNSNL